MKTTYPQAGTLKATGDELTVLGEQTVAGIRCYRVRFKGSKGAVTWAREKIVLRGETA